jgi:DNA polymerase/3'-5' exonuclease PolX
VERPNSKLAECFRKLSKSYQSSPVFPEDVWKAYHFHKIAGRLLSLDFDVVSETNFTMKCLKEIPGISNSTIAMIDEYLGTGTIGRIDRLQRDPMRIAMKNIMGIWGIGRATES